MKTSEQLVNNLLNTPLRQGLEGDTFHRSALILDSEFYTKLALWYFDGHGEVRDHKILFTAHLLTAPASMMATDKIRVRDVGYILLQKLAPHEAKQVLEYCKNKLKAEPRVLKTAVKHYLRALEANRPRFDRSMLRAKDAMRYLYTGLRIKPSVYAQESLFEDKVQKDSLRWAVSRLSAMSTPAMIASIIEQYNIPYLIAIGALKADARKDPVILKALLKGMSTMELINNIVSLDKAEAFADKAVLKLALDKIKAGVSDKRVSTFKAQKAIEAGLKNNEIKQALQEMMNSRIKDMAGIEASTAMFIDISGSMEIAITVARQLAQMIGPVMSGELKIYTFNDNAHQVNIKQKSSLREYEEVFSFLRAGGYTRIGAPLELMRKKKVAVDQIVIITDECDNQRPTFAEEYLSYWKDVGVTPRIIVVTVGGSGEPSFREGIRILQEKAGVKATYFHFTGDYYSLPNVLPLLSGASSETLIEEIEAVVIPDRYKPGVILDKVEG